MPAYFLVTNGPGPEWDDSRPRVRRRLADDPWMDTVLTLESIRPWSIWVGALPG